ncbi:MAG: CRTAC1 family protein [Chitinophagaceae bacterium]|nr:CRTAC1 family protein [Chitinophagaceae bacterium]
MAELLARVAKKNYTYKNDFCAQAKIEQFRASLPNAINMEDSAGLELLLTAALLERGEEEQAVEQGEKLRAQLEHYGPNIPVVVLKTLAICYLRLGERVNCVKNHSLEACIFPIRGTGVQKYTTGSEKAIEVYKEILDRDPNDSESKWLLNVAYMALGRYPQDVPQKHLIAGLGTDTSQLVKPFTDLAMQTGLNMEDMAGGSIVEDFDNDGILDLVTSSWGLEDGMHFFRNTGNGSFTDVSATSGLKQLTGGLNIMQTDYNNDGNKDIFVTRGAWMREYGTQPNSLLRNNGNGTFTDVTGESGLLSFHPTQTATWADFNSDGYLDVFVGNESAEREPAHPCEFYINNKNGTFTNIAKEAKCDYVLYVKGIVSGDINNDGLPDVFISTMDGKKILLRNDGVKNGIVAFTDITQEAGLNTNTYRSFTTWFFDYDNDGWLDIMVAGYHFDKSLAWYAGLEAMNKPRDRSGDIFIYRNMQNGKFDDVSQQLGVNKVTFSMGANFGDINNDGYPDMYFGTGNPLYQSLLPNKMFLNLGGSRFADVTTSSRLGNLQKGHGVSLADLDYDGDQDIYIEMGGAYPGDAYQNSLYINPGQNDNHYIKISLEGTKANRAAIGAKVKVTFTDNGVTRSVYRELNSGGSFGSNPLMQHIGIGQAVTVKSIEIKWPASNSVQQFNDIPADQNIMIKENSSTVKTIPHKRVDFANASSATIGSIHAHQH